MTPPSSMKIWDAPTRLFHWALVILLGFLWWTGEQRMLDWHRLSGYAVLTLLLFRLLWGFAGSSTSRFLSFVRGPSQVFAYVRHDMMRKQSDHPPGHNPLGGWSVILMLLLLFIQVMLGLFSVDVDGIESGPLAYRVSFDTGRWAAESHAVLFNILLYVVVLHVAAVFLHVAYHRHDLLRAMVTGSSRRARGKDVRLAPPLRAPMIFIISTAIIIGLINIL